MTTKIKIDIDDVVRADNDVAKAIEAWAEASDAVASGVCGPTIHTSVFAPSAAKKCGPNDFALYALTGGAAEYVDADDGRIATLVTDDDGEETDEIEWTDDSEVCLIVPSEEDALAHPEALAAMARGVADYHGPNSDRKAWRALLDSIREAAEAVEDIEIDE